MLSSEILVVVLLLREITAESERESQQLQNHWSEVRYLVRCIYRQTGTPLADDQDQPLNRDKESMKELVDRFCLCLRRFTDSRARAALIIESNQVSGFPLTRLCEKDPYQLYQRLEQQAREYVLEMKVRLLKHLSAGPEGPGATHGPPQAHQFISLLLEEYSALCQAARTISSFLLTLVSVIHPSPWLLTPILVLDCISVKPLSDDVV